MHATVSYTMPSLIALVFVPCRYYLREGEEQGKCSCE